MTDKESIKILKRALVGFGGGSEEANTIHQAIEHVVARFPDAIEVIEGMVNQFAYRVTNKKTGPAFTTGGLSDLEMAFGFLGWDDPQPAPGIKCQFEGCMEVHTCGTPTPDGYKWLCGKHYDFYHPRS